MRNLVGVHRVLGGRSRAHGHRHPGRASSASTIAGARRPVRAATSSCSIGRRLARRRGDGVVGGGAWRGSRDHRRRGGRRRRRRRRRRRACSPTRRRPSLGLATGSSPLAAYRLLVEAHDAGRAVVRRRATPCCSTSTSACRPTIPRRYRAFIRRTSSTTSTSRRPTVRARRVTPTTCRRPVPRYDRLLADLGGVDLQLLGIGSDGHVGFNEPGSSLRLAHADQDADRRDPRRQRPLLRRPPDDVPRHVVTQGLGTIRDARHLVLVACGAAKAAPVAAAVEGPLTASCPASILQLHPHATVVVDEAAAAGLALRRLLPRGVRGQADWQHCDAAQRVRPTLGTERRQRRAGPPGPVPPGADEHVARRPDTGAPGARCLVSRARPDGFVLAPGDALEITDFGRPHRTSANDGPAVRSCTEDGTTIAVHVERTVLAPGGVWDVGVLVCGHRRGHATRAGRAPTWSPPTASGGVCAPGVTDAPAAACGDEPAWCRAARAGARRRARPDAWATAAATGPAWSGRRPAVLGARRRRGHTSAIDGSSATEAVVGDDGRRDWLPAGVGRRWSRQLLPRRPPGARGADPTGTRPRVWVARAARRPRPPVLPGGDVERPHRPGRMAQAQPPPPPPHRRRGVARSRRRLPGPDRRRRLARHGLPIPPLLGSGRRATGGSYTVATRSAGGSSAPAELGVVIVPEVDLPGHCSPRSRPCRRCAIPTTRPGRTVCSASSTTRSCPGCRRRWPFVEAVFGASPRCSRLTVVARRRRRGARLGRGSGSPVAAEYAKARGLDGHERHRGRVHGRRGRAGARVTGRQSGSWQEVAEHGGLQPADGVRRRVESADDAGASPRPGYDVVVIAGRRVLPRHGARRRLDVAWGELGRHRRLEDVDAFEPGAGWSDDARRRLLGVQACVWTEHHPSARVRPPPPPAPRRRRRRRLDATPPLPR